MTREHFWLSKAQFERLMPHLPTDTGGKPRVDDRRVISGMPAEAKANYYAALAQPRMAA